VTHAGVLPDFTGVADQDFIDLLLTYDFSAAAVIGCLDTEDRLLMKYPRPDLSFPPARGVGPLGTRGQPETVLKIVADPDCPVLNMLAVPVTADVPVHPDNRPDMIAIR
jgi:hypothetical protein